MTEIPFIVENASTRTSDSKGLREAAERSAQLVKIPAEALRRNLSEASAAVLEALQDMRAVGDYRLKKVVLQVEVSAEGGVSFIGTAQVGAKGGIALEYEAS
jgi:hypothetical protein